MSQFIFTSVMWRMEGYSAGQFVHSQVHFLCRLWIQSFLATGGECLVVIKIPESLKISPVRSQMLGGPVTNLHILAAWGFLFHNMHTLWSESESCWPYDESNHIHGLSYAAPLLAVCMQWAEYSFINSVNWYHKLVQTELSFLYKSVQKKLPVFCLHFPELLNK